jgi:hypothetical protein
VPRGRLVMCAQSPHRPETVPSASVRGTPFLSVDASAADCFPLHPHPTRWRRPRAARASSLARPPRQFPEVASAAAAAPHASARRDLTPTPGPGRVSAAAAAWPLTGANIPRPTAPPLPPHPRRCSSSQVTTCLSSAGRKGYCGLGDGPDELQLRAIVLVPGIGRSWVDALRRLIWVCGSEIPMSSGSAIGLFL